MNTKNTLPQSYQQRVNNNTLATVKRQIQQAENPSPAVVIRVEPARVDNAILLGYLTSKVALENAENRSTDPNIPIENNFMDDEYHLGVPGGSVDYEDEGDKSDQHRTIPTSSLRQWAATELERCDQGTDDVDDYEGDDGDDVVADDEEQASQADNGSTHDVQNWGHSRFDQGSSYFDGYEGKDGDYAYANEEEEALQADDWSTQNVEDWGHSTRECKDWTVYFRPVKNDND